ncbi:hypothetical protein ACJOV8_001430 [Formosa sp. 3Alg 14/1]|uniref:hypothetical protein n=1 Tax=Formosa sp. 3Alg 14/1 TaxID=3382190 RepID=UPI0039BE1CCF
MEKTNSQVVAFTRKEDLIAAKYDKNYDEVISNDICLLSNDSIQDFIENHTILSQQKVKNNDILIAHPFKPNTYLGIETNTDDIQIDKLNDFAYIAQLLGATKFKVTQVTEDFTSKINEADANIQTKAGGGGAGFKQEASENTKKKYIKELSYPGAQPNYEEAYKELMNTGLFIDSQVKNLVKSRNPEKVNNNLNKNQIIAFSVTSEINNNLDIAANLSALGGTLNISSGFKRRVETKSKIELTIEIEF